MMQKFYIKGRFKKVKTWIALIVFCLFSSVSMASAIDSNSLTNLSMVIGELVNLKAYELTRVSIANPEIADINSADDKSIVLVAKNIGQTSLFLWDKFGRRTIMIQVNTQDLVMVKERIQTLLEAVQLDDVSLDINENEGKVVCSGTLTEEEKSVFIRVAEPFMGDLILLFKETVIDDLVLIDAQVTELNQTLTSSLGVDWQTGDNTNLFINYTETLPSTDGDVADYFKIGDFNRTSSLLAVVNAMVEEGEGRILSKPKLLVKSGEEASFLVGGEIPIRTTTSTSSGTTTENVDFKDYGISMNITPAVTNNNKVEMGLKLEITEIDESVKVGSDVGFTKRNTETQLLLDDNQTVVIAGLIKNKSQETIKKVPYLAEIPFLGALFRNKSIPSNQDQELVISLTPHIRPQTKTERPKSKAKVKAERSQQQREQSLLIQNKRKMQAQGADFSQAKRPVVVPKYVSALNNQEKENKRSKELASVYQGIPEEMSTYVYDVQKKIFDAIKFPQQARDHGWEGVVKLELLILEDGTLAFVLVDDSSGFEVFDENAVQTARKVAPFGSFPRGTTLQELNLTIPIVYNQN